MYVYSDSERIDDEIIQLHIDGWSYNPPINRYKITKYPTYVLLKMESQEVVTISNRFEDIKEVIGTKKK